MKSILESSLPSEIDSSSQKLNVFIIRGSSPVLCNRSLDTDCPEKNGFSPVVNVLGDG